MEFGISHSLIDESLEARRFVDEVIARPAEWKRFPTERFEHLLEAVLATSEVDLQGDQIAPEALQHAAQQVQQRSLWVTHEHNPLNPPLGRVLTAEAFYSAASDLHFIAGVVGLYPPDDVCTFDDLDINPDELPAPELPVENADTSRPGIQLCHNPHEMPSDLIAEMLVDAPSVVARKPAIEFRKSADPVTILGLSLSLGMLMQPFAAKVGEALGQRSVEGAADFVRWLRSSVFSRFSRIENEALFEFQSEHQSCRVQFVVPSKDPAVLSDATQTVHEAATRAAALLAVLEPYGPEKLVYRYDPSSTKWWPSYAATAKRGVIRDSRWLVVMDQFRSEREHAG